MEQVDEYDRNIENFDCGILLGLSPAKVFKGMEDQGAQRESLVILYKTLAARQIPPLYAPAQHREMLEKIYQNITVPVLFAEAAPAIDGETELVTRINPVTLTAKMYVKRYGSDLREAVRRNLKELCLKKLEPMPILDPYG